MKISSKHLFLFVLVSAYLNAVLRFSSSSNITLFRVLLPITLLLIYYTSKPYFTMLIKVVSALLLITTFQYLLSRYLFYSNVSTISFNHQIEYLFHAFCIVVVFFVVMCLKLIEGVNFSHVFIKFGAIFVKLTVVVYLIYLATGQSPYDFLLFGNINDLGCVLTIGVLILLFEPNAPKFINPLFIILILYILVINDSKER